MIKDIKALKEMVKELTVLYVEDEDEMRSGSELFLKKFFNFVETAKDGEEGLEKFQTNRHDIIFTDVMMPRMDGEEMIKKIKEIDNNIFCVTLTASEVRLEDIKEMCDLYYRKPISYDDMNTVLQEIVKKFNL
ncbi:response regulator [Candidatus Sulfurimonas baltica]|uniref:Response regulator n=1 Tax=Candidatus Sulfurimonas baltica TaxID=2740404 RepID=A0A7S7LVS2_9BACT|nr:response regulator [Candidatus Sulfurimonas baltica]QOY52266.1 response regulator [Candidatus Sulfurimonas baltica]